MSLGSVIIYHTSWSFALKQGDIDLPVCLRLYGPVNIQNFKVRFGLALVTDVGILWSVCAFRVYAQVAMNFNLGRD